jgi:broad specificity phosphatase PhoE
VRHARPDWERIERLGWTGPAVDLVPLAEDGVQHAEVVGRELTGTNASIVLSSPMPRALQTASIIAAQVKLPLRVEFDLREWQPHTGLAWKTLADAQLALANMLDAGEKGLPQPPFAWEPLSSLRARCIAAIAPHAASHDGIIAVCHEIVILALTGQRKTPHGGCVRFEMGSSE